MSERQQVRTASTPATCYGRVQRGLLQRQSACGQHTHGGQCEDCAKKQMPLQRKPGNNASVDLVPPIVHEVLRSSGQPLDRSTRAFFEPRFGRDFSQVRVHTDERAAQSARAVNANAYTVGSNLVFAPNQFAPSTTAGQSLLAHELVHVMQQSGASTGLSAGDITLGKLGDNYEAEASRISEQTLRGQLPTTVSTGANTVQRQSAGTTNATGKADAKEQPTGPPQAKRGYTNGIDPFVFGDWGIFATDLKPPDRRGAPCRLDAVTRVKFNFNTADPLPPHKRDPWAKKFASLVSRHWSYRYLLVPSKPCDLGLCDATAVRVRVEPVTAKEHHVINVHRSTERSDMANLAEGDVETGPVMQRQRVALHEGGHLFGLEHIWCKSNKDWCYGWTAGSADDVLGRGEYVSARDYAPFVAATNQMTHCDWKTGGPGGEGRGVPSLMLGLGVLGLLGGGLAGGLLGGLGGAIALGLGAGAVLGLIGWAIDMSPGNVPTPKE